MPTRDELGSVDRLEERVRHLEFALAEARSRASSASAESASGEERRGGTSLDLGLALIGAIGTGIGVLAIVTLAGGLASVARFRGVGLPGAEGAAVMPRQVLLALGADVIVPMVLAGSTVVLILFLIDPQLRSWKLQWAFMWFLGACGEVFYIYASGGLPRDSDAVLALFAVTLMVLGGVVISLAVARRCVGQAHAQPTEVEVLTRGPRGLRERVRRPLARARDLADAGSVGSGGSGRAAELTGQPDEYGAEGRVDSERSRPTPRFGWFAGVVFAFVVLYSSLAVYASNMVNPRVRAGAVLHQNHATGVAGIWVGHDSAWIYLGHATPARGNPIRGEPHGRIVVLRRDSVAAMAIGPFESLAAATRRQGALLDQLRRGARQKRGAASR